MTANPHIGNFTQSDMGALPHPGANPELPLTPLQLGMVYESALAGRPWLNLEQIVVRLENETLEAEPLKRAWAQIADRHEALRLAILWRKRVIPTQILRPSIDVPLRFEEWSHLPAPRQEARLTQFLASDREQGVDLEAGPSWRVTLIRLAPKRAVMIWTIHHALVDGRSMAIVLEELFDLLAQRPLAAPSQQGFLDYSKALLARDTTEAKDWFSTYLEGFEQPNVLSQTIEGEDGAKTGRNQQISTRLDPALTEALRERADAAGVTLANLVQGAWGMVVARWTGRRRAVFGITRAGRHVLADSQRIVGCLINTLPMRVQIAPPLPTDQFLAGLRADMLAMRTHEHANLSDIRQWCGLPGKLSLFESMLMFEHQSLDATMRAISPAWATRRVELYEEGAQPLTLAAYGDEAMLLVLEHNPQLISRERAEAFLNHMRELLASLAKAPSTTVLSHLTMLPRAEEAAVIALGRPDNRISEPIACVWSQFFATTADDPMAKALSQIGTDYALSRQALQDRAAELAKRLAAHGAAPGQIVAISLPRGADFIVSILAVLRTGAAFLPVDPTYPEPLAAHMLRDSAAQLLIAPAGHQPATAIKTIDPQADAPIDEFPPLPIIAPDPERLAYVIYTSGSTGLPKGVRVPMRAISAHAQAMIQSFALTPADRVLQFASLSFDVSIEEILPTLLSGAQLILRDEEMAGSIGYFLDQIRAAQITVLNLPTAFWHILVDEMARNHLQIPDTVRLVIVGGEQISPRALATWQRLAPKPRWLNGYGPTETTITCTLHEPGPMIAGEDVPIGRPTPHARAYILAPDGSLSPPGAPGELWIGGAAVSSGYIGHEEQMAAAFHPDRFQGTGRMYRTGDIARWRLDGTLAFLGRRDRQVKLRGFRVDLRHVERAIEALPEVGRALARVLNQGTPAARLVAWVAGSDGAELPDINTLRLRIADRLPPHMMPALAAVSDFPRTPGGKIDLSALPEPALAQAAIDHTPADDPLLRHISQLMAEVLGLEHVSADDEFFTLGGHSLLAVQLIGRVEAEIGHRLGVADLHRRPSPRGLAAAITLAQSGPRYILPIQPNGRRPPLFGVHVLGRNEEHYRPLAAALGPDQPVYGLTVGLLAQDTPTGVKDTARAYAEEIQRYFPAGPISLAAVSLASYVAYELAQQLLRAGRDVRMVVLFDSAGPGGRSKLSGKARIAMHMKQLLRQGPRYLYAIFGNKAADFAYRFKRLRHRALKRKIEIKPLSVDAFIVANELAVQQYEVRPIHRPLTIFRATGNIFDSPESSRDGLGWASVAAAGFDVIDIPGDHLSILQEPNVVILANALQNALQKAPKG